MRHPTGEPSQRQLRVGEELRHALSQAFERGELRDPRLAGVNLTVTEVSASPDLKNALVYVVPLGSGMAGHDDPTPVIEALEHARSFLRSYVGKAVRLRHVPNLHFAFDTSFDRAIEIDELLNSPAVARDWADAWDSSGDDSGEDDMEDGENSSEEQKD
ncbi:MAG: 30S ribosome-binding factor RbfA [Magnetovibrionaceae bacterium]